MELKSKRRLILRGAHRPILVVEDQGRIFALDNRCPHMGFPLDRGSIEDGILTCHWHHARFDLASGCTFDLWADDVPTCEVELRGNEVWIQTDFGHSNAAAYWQRRLEQGMAHNLGLIIAKAVQGLVSRVTPVHTAMRNSTRDEGGPFEVDNQVLISSHRKLLWSKAMVVSVAEKPKQDSGRHD